MIIASLMFAALAAAPESEAVRLRLGDCVPTRDLVHDLLGIELGFERLVEDSKALEVTVECAEDHVLIGLHPNLLGVRDRRIEKDELSARAVALNITELIQDYDNAERPAAVLRSEVAEIKTDPVAPEPRARLRFLAAPSLRVLSSPDRVALGLKVGTGYDLGETWALHAAIGVEDSKGEVLRGEIRTRVLAGSIGIGPRFGLSPTWTLFALAGASGGYVKIDGKADSAETIARSGSGPWFGPSLAARLRYGERAGVTLGLEAGWTTYGVYGDAAGRERVGLRGGWLGAELAFDWSFR